MKFLRRLTIFALLAFVLVACQSGDNNLPTRPEADNSYVGTMIVDQNDGTTYTDSAAKVAFEITPQGTANFKMYGVKFSERMPLTLTMTVEGLTAEPTTDGYTLSGNNIVPYALGGKFEKYTITEFRGTLTDSHVEMSFMCGEYPLSYEGRK